MLQALFKMRCNMYYIIEKIKKKMYKIFTIYRSVLASVSLD